MSERSTSELLPAPLQGVVLDNRARLSNTEGVNENKGHCMCYTPLTHQSCNSHLHFTAATPAVCCMNNPALIAHICSTQFSVSGSHEGSMKTELPLCLFFSFLARERERGVFQACRCKQQHQHAKQCEHSINV